MFPNLPHSAQNHNFAPVCDAGESRADVRAVLRHGVLHSAHLWLD